jgi:predicted transcriptional regulator
MSTSTDVAYRSTVKLPRICTLQQVADFLGMSKDWVRKRKPPTCPGIKRPLKVYTESAEFQQWLAQIIRSVDEDNGRD